MQPGCVGGLELTGVGRVTYPRKPLPNTGLPAGDRTNDYVAIGLRLELDFTVWEQARLLVHSLRNGGLAFGRDFHWATFLFNAVRI